MTENLERKGWQWAAVPAAVITSAKLKPVDVRVYAYLLWRAGSKGYAWPGVETIARDIHVSPQLVKLSLNRLSADFWINRKRRMSASTVTYVYEKRAHCKKERKHSQLTGWPSVSQPVSRQSANRLADRTRFRGTRVRRKGGATRTQSKTTSPKRWATKVTR